MKSVKCLRWNISVDKQSVKTGSRRAIFRGALEIGGSGPDSWGSVCCVVAVGKSKKKWTWKYREKGFSGIQRESRVQFAGAFVDGERARTRSAASRLAFQAVNGEWPFCAWQFSPASNDLVARPSDLFPLPPSFHLIARDRSRENVHPRTVHLRSHFKQPQTHSARYPRIRQPINSAVRRSCFLWWWFRALQDRLTVTERKHTDYVHFRRCGSSNCCAFSSRSKHHRLFPSFDPTCFVIVLVLQLVAYY